MKILIINGPNLNLLGKREPGIYGSQSFADYFEKLKQSFPQLELTYFQSNHEGALVDRLQQADEEVDGVVLNAAAYTHTSVALGDAIAAIKTPVVEVHISNVHAREEFRQRSFLSKHCVGVIFGFGLESYRLALQHFLFKITDK
ncbi:MAG: type II 3-dehydroquinate dehydratase [Cyclobacteriaceae bacterium]